jgi:hypothetical protein
MSTRPFFDEQTRLYWILKGRTEQGIPERPEIGQMFRLEKAALFNYPIGQVLLVCNDDFEAIAYAKVLSFEQDSTVTRVQCQIVKGLSSKEKQTLTTYLQTTQQLVKGQA